MTTVNNRGLRYFTIAALLAVGIVTTLATGGGGSGGVTVPPSSPPTLNITAQNGNDVASALVIAIGLSFDLGDITDENIAAQPTAGLLSAPLSKGVAGLFKSVPPAVLQAPVSCDVSGTVDATITQANINTLTAGDRIVAVFVDCNDGLGYVISGTVDLTVAAFQGDLNAGVFLLGMDVLMTDVVVTEGTSVTTAEGDFTLTLDSLDFPVMRMSLSGNDLHLGSDGEVVALTDFDHALHIDTVTTALVANVLGRLASSTLGGSVDYETTIAIEATGDNDPHIGEILITGAGDSSARIVVIDSNNIRLEIDENGDGTVDAFIDTNWAELNGRHLPPVTGSTINSETAPILAREIYNAVTGFDSVTTAAGRQFLWNSPFAQLNELQVAGEFGPLQIGCENSGTAVVSGIKAVETTFGPGDDLSVSFDACDGFWESLFGAMEFSIGSFDDVPDGFYVVSGTVVESSLQRVHGGTCFTGTGTVNISFDAMFTAIPYHYANSSTSDFTVSAGGRSQHLTGASVNAEFVFPMAPAIVTRESYGVMTGTDLAGSFSYQSLIPDEFTDDDDPATGPHAGELLVTAADNSSMRMVAIDEFNLRLDLDFNGDSRVDQSIPTTYATLGYDDMICP